MLPISYGDALPLLKALAGPMAPEDWRGALPIPYHLGPGPARVHLKLEFNWDLKPIYDVIARLPGSERPDEWVIRGNHHDGWVNGASDPISGLVAELAEARAVGELAKSGWKPKRTIIYAAWDGEEPGLLGSTEWAETHADELREHAARLHQLRQQLPRLLRRRRLAHPGDLRQPGGPRRDRSREGDQRPRPLPRRATQLFGAARAAQEARGRASSALEPLGSGSDFTPFLQHLGIAALNIGYGGEEEYGQYHSIYDSFDHFTRFVDPNFDYGVALAKTAGRLVLRLADADVLPFDFDRFADAVGRYVDEVEKLAEHPAQGGRGAQPRPRRQDLPGGRRPDPDLGGAAAPGRRALPQLRAAPERRGGAQEEHRRLRQGDAAATAGGKRCRRRGPAAAQRHPDEVRARPDPTEGLPRRSWYVHQIYAPGFYTGYGVKTLPAVREAIEQRNWKEAEQQIRLVAGTIDGFATEIDKATAVLGGGGTAAGR